MKKRQVEKDVNLNSVTRKIQDKLYSASVAIHNKFPKKQNGSVKSGSKREFWFFHLLWAIPMIQFVIIYVFVNFQSILLAFQTYDKMTGEFIFGGGKENFRRVFTEITSPTAPLGYALKNSFTVYLVSLVITTPLALFFSFYMFKKLRFTELFRTVLFLPSILSPVILTSIFYILMNTGMATLMESITGVADEKYYLMAYTNDATRFPLVVAFGVIVGFGTNVLMYTNAMSQIDESVIEAAELDGASFLREFSAICLPLIYPTITTFLTVGIVGFFTNQANLYSFFKADAELEDYTIGYYLFKIAASKESMIEEFPFAAAMGVVFSAVAIPVTLFMRWALEKFGPQTEL